MDHLSTGTDTTLVGRYDNFGGRPDTVRTTTTDRIGRAMLRVARVGSARRILENADLR